MSLFFLYSLFLAEHHFSEQNIGLITTALTIGTIICSIPAGYLARRVGLRPVMLIYIAAAPVLLAMRVFFMPLPAQLVLAFIAGVAMSLWTVSFSPALSAMTTRENRTFGFSIFIAAGIFSGVFGGIAGGHLSTFLNTSGFMHGDGIRSVLLLACGIVSTASVGLLRLRFGAVNAQKHVIRMQPVLLRFLLTAAL